MRTLGMLGEVIGMAASVCRKHDCLPKAVYDNYLEELKALMTAGINMEAPCSWNVGHQDGYHFMRPVGMFDNQNENCWVRYDVNGKPIQEIPQGLQDVIDRLGIQRKPYSQQ
jgi:hypothetical protein